jgi:hypothetical protein
MCLDIFRKWFCGKCEPEVIVKTEVETVEKIVEKVVEKVVTKVVEKPMPMAILNSNFEPKRQGTPTKEKENNKKIYDYLFSLDFKGDYYSQLESVISLKIKKNGNYIEVNRNRRLCSDGDFV